MVLTRGDDDGPRSGDRNRPVAEQAVGIDNGTSLLGEPGNQWTVDANDLVAGGTVTPLNYSQASDTSLIAFGDVAVVSVENLEEQVLVGLDSATGETLWTVPGDRDATPNCWAVLDETRLLCFDYATGDGEYSLLDPETGEVLQTQPLGGLSGIASSRDTLYLVHDAGESTLALVVDAVMGATGRAVWKRPLPGGIPERASDPLVTLDGSRLLVDFGSQGWGIDTRTGALVDVVEEYPGLDRGGYRVESTYQEEGDPLSIEVTDEFGNLILSAPGDAWTDPVYESVVDGRIGIGDTLYDLATGDPLWSREDLYVTDEDGYANPWRWADDPSAILIDDPYVDDYQTVGDTVVDATSGEPMLYSESALYSTNSTFTDDAVAAGQDDGRLQVFSRSTGEIAWERDLADVVFNDDLEWWSGVVSTDSSLVVAGYDQVTGFSDFGDVPGTGTDADADGSDDGSDGGTSYATDCGSEPTFTPVESEASYGGVTTTFTVTAVCPGGQWLSSSTQLITMTADTDSGSQLFASGVFDFSDRPVWVPDESGEPIELPLTFPGTGTYATPDEINDGIASQVIHVDCTHEPDSYAGPVPSDPADGADPSTPVPAYDSGQDVTSAEDSALAALERLAAQDDPYLASTFEGLWVPQLSSKVSGTQDDGIIYTYEDILAEHLRLRLRYPDVRLAQSSDWKSFLVPGYWVTLVGLTSARPGPALDFCSESGFTPDHCYAKLLLRDGPSEGTVKSRR